LETYRNHRESLYESILNNHRRFGESLSTIVEKGDGKFKGIEDFRDELK
jgi:hypothetical protein